MPLDRYGGRFFSRYQRRRQKEYFKKLFQGDIYNGGFSIKEVLDTNSQHIRIRCQMKDLGSYEVSQKVESLRKMVNRTLNPNKAWISWQRITSITSQSPLKP